MAFYAAFRLGTQVAVAAFGTKGLYLSAHIPDNFSQIEK
jgi:hypothetical protein